MLAANLVAGRVRVGSPAGLWFACPAP